MRRIILIFLLLFSLCAFCQNKLTVMAYISGGNAAEHNSFDPIAGLSQIPELDTIEVVYFWDRHYGYSDIFGDNKDTRMGTLKGTHIQYLKIYDQLNAGDPATFIEFIDYVYTEYRADNYILIMWDHSNKSYEHVCFDEESGDYLTQDEFADCLDYIKEEYDIRPSMIVLDTKFGISMEHLNNLKDRTDYILGSETLMSHQSTGYAQNMIAFPIYYTDAVQSFIDHHDNTLKIAEAIIDSSFDHYSKDDYNVYGDFSFSLVTTEKLKELTGLFRTFAKHIKEIVPIERDTFRYAIDNCSILPEDHADLYSWCAYLMENARDYRTRRLSRSICEKIYETVIYKKITEGKSSSVNFPDLSGTHGISFFYPLKKSDFNYFEYKKKEFSEYTYWGDYLLAYFSDIQAPDKVDLWVTIEPESVSVARARKSAGSYVYSKVTDSDFTTGNAYICGIYPYSPYENDRYQLQMKFDLEFLFKDNPAEIEIKDVHIYHWADEARMKKGDFLAYKTYKEDYEYYTDDLLIPVKDCIYGSSSFSGRGLRLLFEHFRERLYEDHTIVYGYGIDEDPGYMRRFDPEKVNLSIKYSY